MEENKQKPKKSKTDCKTPEGRIVGLIDSIGVIVKELGPLMSKHTPAIKEAICDLQHDIKEWEMDRIMRSPKDIIKEKEERELLDKTLASIRKTLLIEDHHGWVDIHTKLPDINEKVDVYMPNFGRYCNVYLTTERKWAKDNPKKMRDTGRVIKSSSVYQFGSVSHWRVIPHIPEAYKANPKEN